MADKPRKRCSTSLITRKCKQGCGEVPLPRQDDSSQIPRRSQRIWSPVAAVGTLSGAGLVENSTTVSQKINHGITIDPAVSLLGTSPNQ